MTNYFEQYPKTTALITGTISTIFSGVAVNYISGVLTGNKDYDNFHSWIKKAFLAVIFLILILVLFFALKYAAKTLLKFVSDLKFKKYTEDTIEGFKYKWKWSYGYYNTEKIVTDLILICHCGHEFKPNLHFSQNGEMNCPDCKKNWKMPYNKSDVESLIKNRFKRSQKGSR